VFKPIDTIRNSSGENPPYPWKRDQGLVIRDQRGFTLIELIIAMSIGLIGAMGGYALLANMQGTMSGNSAAVQAQQEARIIVERIARELRESSPDWVWPSNMTYEESDYIVFLTPRNEDRTFIVDSEGKPQWQRAILYRLDSDSKLRRYQVYMSGTAEPHEISQSEVVSKRVERLLFSRTDDMVTISIRTFSDHNGKVGHVARSHADLYTMVKLRN
jgi:prepilin-type N-terminal cleavage/methylation domain-containing protein